MLRIIAFNTLFLLAIGVSILAHIAELIRPDLAHDVYTNAVQLWSYPQLALLCLGTLRVDLRRRQSRLGVWPLLR